MKTILVYGLKNSVGGIENYLMMMQKYLHNDIKFIFIVEETEKFIYLDRIYNYGGEVVFIPERHNFNEYKKELQSILVKFRDVTNIFYINVGHISFDIIPISLANRNGYKVITHSHNAMQEPINNFFYRFRQDILRSIAMIRLKHMDVVRLAVSELAGEYLYKGRSYKIVTPGIETNMFRYNSSVRKSYRQELDLDNALVIGFVGRLVSVKNPLFLVDVLKDLLNRGIGSKLLIVGDGVLKDNILSKAQEYQIEDNLIFTGAVNNVCDYLQAMDILLAPSLSEGLGLFIVEAQAAGLPCICSEGNIPKSINVTGRVTFESIISGSSIWSEKVETILSSQYNRENDNQLVYNSDFNIQKTSKQLHKILLSCNDK